MRDMINDNWIYAKKPDQMTEEDFKGQVVLCKRWLKANTDPTMYRKRKMHTAYFFKHRVEETYGGYICMESFVQAAGEMNYGIKTLKGDVNPTVYFRFQGF